MRRSVSSDTRLPGRLRWPATVLAVLLAAVPAAAQTPDDIARALSEAGATATVRAFYAQRAQAPAWVRAGRQQPGAAVATAFLSTAPAHGLDAGWYRIPTWPPDPTAADAARYDVALTEAVLQLAGDLTTGRVSPRRVHPGWTLPHRGGDWPARLDAALHAGTLSTVLKDAAPRSPAYRALAEALAALRETAATGGWMAMPDSATLQRGSEGPGVAALRTRLLRSDDRYTPTDTAAVFDLDMDEAVRRFQSRHGLRADGEVGPATRQALNVTAERRARQVAINMERLRWMPDSLGPRYVLVNTASCSLRVVEDGRDVLGMRVVVGAPATRTPVFSATITGVVLAPYWYAPTSIAETEILPYARRDSTYLDRHHMRILPGGVVRQEPGPTNPLGRLKLIVPNPYDVGLHDTPEQARFREEGCAFSHGCIRLGNPLALAAYVIRDDTTWSPARLEAAIGRWKEHRIAAPPLPLHVVYWTAWVDARGVVHFRTDRYGHDAVLQALMDAR